ncbi:MAG: FAD-binding oxidoreductase [Chloroflexi bacterium]|nr:FAD-binding oxidoreductase [Chloroflexota bacterium]
MERTDVVVIGGGIIGCAVAAILATRGARVILVEATEIGAGASGRNLGAIQHPFDPVLAPLHRESLERYHALAAASDGAFAIGTEPAGLLLVTGDADAAARQVRRMAAAVPELAPELVTPEAMTLIEPSLAPGLSAVRLATGHPIPPVAATEAWATLAHERGARLQVGVGTARPVVEHGRAIGVRFDDGTRIGADRVVVAAGPWSPALVDPAGLWRPIVATWGVTLQLRLGGAAPRHIVEEDEVDAVNRAAAATSRAAHHAEEEPPSLFSVASAGGVSTLGSTFLPVEPDPARIEPLLLRRAAAFLPAVAEAEVVGRRVCARPQSVDGRPFIGELPGIEGLHVCAGHGPWGISTGPASAAIVARAILDGTVPPPELAAARVIAPG